MMIPQRTSESMNVPAKFSIQYNVIDIAAYLTEVSPPYQFYISSYPVFLDSPTERFSCWQQRGTDDGVRVANLIKIPLATKMF